MFKRISILSYFFWQIYAYHVCQVVCGYVLHPCPCNWYCFQKKWRHFGNILIVYVLVLASWFWRQVLLTRKEWHSCLFVLSMWIICCANSIASSCSKLTVSLRYADLVSILPTCVSVVAWPMPQFKKSPSSAAISTRRGTGVSGAHLAPLRLSYAEEALRTMSLPEGCACYE